MNTKGTKFLAVLAVLAMAFATVAVVGLSYDSDAADAPASYDEDTAIDSETTVAAESTTTIKEGVTITVTSTLTVSGTLVNNGTIAISGSGKLIVNGTLQNNGVIDETGNGSVNHEMLQVEGADAKITAASDSAKGTIKGTNNPLVNTHGGVIQSQIIDGTRMAPMQQPAVTAAYGADNITNPLTISKCVFKLGADGKGIRVDTNSDKQIAITGNTFESVYTDTSKSINVEVVDTAVAKADLTGNTFQVAGYGETGGDVTVVGTSTGVNKIGTASTDDVRIDSAVKKLIIAGTENIQINSNLTLDEIYLYGTAQTTLNADKTLTVGVLFNKGTINNAGTISVEKSIKSMGTITGAGDVRYKNSEAEVQTAGTAADIQGIIQDPETESAVIKITAGSSTQTAVAVGTKDVAIDISTNAVSKLDFAVAEGGSISIAATANYSGVITAGTQKITMTNVQGAFTIVPGSIVIDGEVKGDIVLEKGAELKVKETLTITGASSISVATPASETATIIIEEGAVATLDAALTISGGITVKVYGKVTGAGSISVAKEIDTFDGSIVNVDTVTGAGKIVAYSGSDINGIDTLSITTITGKDAASGAWLYDGTTLILNNYNGTYNFDQIADTVTVIKLIGDSTITYTAPATLAYYYLFGEKLGEVEATVGSESLTINADLSAVEDIGALYFTVIATEANFVLEQVNLAINVTGSNAKWAAEDILLADVAGMDVYDDDVGTPSLTVEGTASLSINVLSALTTDALGIYGLYVEGTTDIKSNSVLAVSAPAIAFEVNGAFTVKFESTVTINGDMTSGISTNVNNKSSLTVSGLLTAEALEVTLESVVDLNDVVLSGASSNDVEMTVNGNMLIASGTFTNNGKLTNNGTILVIGNLTNNGTFDNNGTISVPAKKIGTQDTPKTLTFTNDEYAQLGANVAMIKQISLITHGYEDGSGIVGVAAGNLMVFTKDSEGIATEEEFMGTIVMTQDGKGYTIVLENAAGTTKITIVYDSTKATDTAFNQIGTDYTVSVSGKVTVAGDLYNLTANTYKKDHAGTVAGTLPADETIFAANTGTFSVAVGTFTNAGSVIVSANGGTILAADATWNGPITANTALEIKGKFNGDILSNDGAIIVGSKAVIKGNITAVGNLDIDGTVTGDIVTKGTVSVDKKVTGNISTENEVTVTGELVGNVTITGASQFISTAGKMNGELTYNYAYLAKKGDAAKTEGSATMKIVGKATYTIALVAAVDAPSDSVDGTAGFFRYATAPSAVDKDGIEFTLLAGTFDQNSSVIMPVGSSFVVETGTVFQIDKSFEFNVVDSALKISDSATANIDLGSDVPDYGVVTYVMSFTKAEGYTIYSNLAYALANADEGSVLTVGQSTVIKTSVEIGTGITVEVPKDIVLTFQNDAGKSMDLFMNDGAKIELIDNGKVVFAASGDDTDDPELEAGDSFEYYSVSGTIVFGDNVVEFDGVRFTAESTLVGVAATETVPAKISTTLLYNEGTATIAAGVGTGSITLSNATYLLVKEDDESATLVTATFEVADGAVFDAVAIVDEFGTVKYVLEDEEIIVDEIRSCPTNVVIDGTLNLSANTIVKGIWSGSGKVTLAENKSVTFAACDALAVGDNRTIAPTAAFLLVDTTEDENGYTLAFAPDFAETVVFTAKKVKLDGEDAYVMTVGGTIGIGAIEATVAAVLDQLTIEELAAVVADTTYLLKDKDSTAFGYLMTKEIYMKAEGVTAYGELDYQVTFEQDGYTVYAYFRSVDLDEITDLEIADNFTLADLVGAGEKLDLTGKDISITVAEGKVLTVDKILFIGTPMTTLGGTVTITGTLLITDGNYIAAYSNVVLSDANIVQEDGETAAVNSILTIDDVLYATVFANEDNVRFAISVDKIKPVIAGYNFTKWERLNEAANPWIGETNAFAGAKAILITVTVKYAEGVSYYLNGVEFAIYDTPTKVDYNSVFTAKINNTAQYQGTPLINGQNSFQVTENATLTVTGVTPIPAPEPEPAGMSLTEILLIVLVVLIAIMVVIIALRLNRS